MIEVQRVRYFYPDSDAPALSGLDLDVGAGEMYLLAGRSGSGKSTALRAVTGLVPRFYGGRFAGHVRTAGLDTRRHAPLEISARVGTVFQEPANRFLARRAEDEIAWGLELAGLSSAEIARRLDGAIERMGLGALLGRSLDTLSAGEQQRVAVAAALAREPAVLLLDEPTSQLDGGGAEEVVDWVASLSRESGLGVLLGECRLGRWVRAAQRVGWMEAGRILAEGAPEEVLPDLPIAPPLARAARALGLHAWMGPEAEEAIASRLCEAAMRDQGSGIGEPDPSSPPSSPPLSQPPQEQGGKGARGGEEDKGGLLHERGIEEPAAGPGRLRAQGIRFAFGKVPVLAGVDLDVRAGETLAVVGRNGSGKTTLLRCLMGLLAPDSGEVELDGRSIAGQPVYERARRIGYVPQWPAGLLFARDLREELQITLHNLGLEEHPPVQPEEILRRFGLTEVAGRYPRDLSAGQRQRAALAAILVARPQVLLLDEPTLGMDLPAQEDLGRWFAELQAAGTAIVIATHDVEFAARFAQRCAVIESGRVAEAGPTAGALFSRPESRTALQRLTGQPHPASVEEIVREAA